MAMLLTESQMIQRVEFEEWGINFIKENKELYESLEAKILVENIKLEKFHREYKFLIDDLFPEKMLNESELLDEGILTDLSIGLGSMIPGIGSAVAAGGTVYYLVRAFNAQKKGETMTMYMELLSSFLTAGQIVPVIGSIVGAVGKVIAAPFKLLFSGLKSLGSLVLKLFGFDVLSVPPNSKSPTTLSKFPAVSSKLVTVSRLSIVSPDGSIFTAKEGGRFRSPLLGSIPLARKSALACDSTVLDV